MNVNNNNKTKNKIQIKIAQSAALVHAVNLLFYLHIRMIHSSETNNDNDDDDGHHIIGICLVALAI
jgi:hypothetical protein